MAKKSAPKKSVKEKPTMIKIAEKVGQLAAEIVVGKDHLVEMAGDAIESVKSGISEFTTSKKNVPKKTVKAKAKQAVKKSTRPAIKKAAGRNAGKKTAPIKKVAKKVAKKAVKKAVKKIANKAGRKR